MAIKNKTLNFILNLTFQGWKKIQNIIKKHFKNSKDAEYKMMIDLLDHSVPLTLDIYAVLFRSGFFEGYLESVVRIWVLFQRLRRHNYNKVPLIFLTKVIDAERTNRFSFKDAFVNSRNSTISHIKLDYLEKKTSLFLLSLFDDIYNNIGNTQQVNRNKYPNFSLPTFKINVDVKVLLLAWNTEIKPSNNKIYDANKCLLSNNIGLLSDNDIVLNCGHAYHKQCLDLLKGNCEYCLNYLSLNIKKNINSLKKRLLAPLKNNEKPLVEDEDNNNLNEDTNEENIENILEKIESNIDN
ncbi:hypothetical protein RhiirA1_478031 [Rhizophagus irregularis]|uniref:RING-type domain-containing protein n=1 Tax=Rhizophagus irregularis TaxID=588596 RepID=A0A2N0QSM3_9GLOM|nr:hypothetical protein RhiirA1_478031 [Rhizophagus irregularis]